MSTSSRLDYTRSNEIKFDQDSDSSISNDRIDDMIANLLSITKQMSFGMGFLIFKTSLAFIKLKKAFIKALIIHFFDLKRYI